MADGGGAGRITKLKSPEKEDRLSALPDPLIHHILSLLPSTKQAIRTGILSKRWLNQWTFVSNLFFNFSGMSSHINQTLFLHQCSKIHKFHITKGLCDESIDEDDPDCEEMIRFVVRKQVEDLVLNFPGMANWGSLKDLSIESCSCSDEVIASIVSGSPLLQSLELKNDLRGLERLVVASKSLKRLAVSGINCYLDVSCPNLVEFYLGIRNWDFGWCGEVLEEFLSGSPLLESLELKYFELSNVRIASHAMKKLVFLGWVSHEIAISCPNLEELLLHGNFQAIRLMNLPSLARASFDLMYHHKKTVVKEILESVQHVNELEFGSFFTEALSGLEIDGALHPLLNNKSLTLEGLPYGTTFADIPGIVVALRCSPMLERLVLNLWPYLDKDQDVDLSEQDYSEENYWNSNETRFTGLVSHLRTVEITNFSHRLVKHKLVLDFVEFLLKNASVLEKVVIPLDNCGADFVIKVSQKLLSFTRSSAAATVELVCSR